MEEQVEMVGKAFVDHYYHLFDTNRTSLASLYQPSSMLTFEGQKMVGVEQITAKLNGMPFDHCKHLVSTIDSQAAPPATGGVVVFVSGSLQLFGEEHPLRFSQDLCSSTSSNSVVQVSRISLSLISSNSDKGREFLPEGGSLTSSDRDHARDGLNNIGDTNSMTLQVATYPPSLEQLNYHPLSEPYRIDNR